jgi:hypothetical protein
MGLAFLLAVGLVALVAWQVCSRLAQVQQEEAVRGGSGRGDREPAPGAERRAPALPPAAGRGPARSQVLFATPGRGCIELDGVLVEPYGSAQPGVPFHLRLRPPATPALTEVASALLSDWATDGDTVELSITSSLPARARLTDGNVTIVLDLEESSLR